MDGAGGEGAVRVYCKVLENDMKYSLANEKYLFNTGKPFQNKLTITILN